MIEENKEKVPQELKEEVEGKIAILKTAVAENNVAEMQAAIKELNDSLQKVGQAVYSEASEPAETTEETPPGDDEPGADTVEGEFREV